MRFSALFKSRSRAALASLLLVFALAVPSLVVASGAGASTTSIAKKAKKCKKGYKKVGKKCKKKKKPAAASNVTSLKLNSLDPSAYGTTLKGTVVVKTGFTSLKLTITRFRKGAPVKTRTETITSDGVATTVNFEVRAPISITPERTKAPIKYWVEAAGVTSNKL